MCTQFYTGVLLLLQRRRNSPALEVVSHLMFVVRLAATGHKSVQGPETRKHRLRENPGIRVMRR